MHWQLDGGERPVESQPWQAVGYEDRSSAVESDLPELDAGRDGKVEPRFPQDPRRGLQRG